MTVKLLTEHLLEFLSLKGGCTASYESTLVKMLHCWKSHVMAHLIELKIFHVGRVLDWVIGSRVQDSLEHCVVSLSQTLHPMFNTGSTQEDRQSSRHD